jgi:hypothetical protein
MTEEFLVQTEEPSLIRNTHSKALLNKDRKALEEYKTRKNFLLKVKNEDQETKDYFSDILNIDKKDFLSVDGNNRSQTFLSNQDLIRNDTTKTNINNLGTNSKFAKRFWFWN